MTITVRGYTGIKPPKMPTEDWQMVADEGFDSVCYRYDKSIELMVKGREGKVDDNVRLEAIQGAYRAMEAAYLAPTVTSIFNKSPVSGELKSQFEAKSKLFENAADRSLKLHGGPGHYVDVKEINPTSSARGGGFWRPGGPVGYGQERFDSSKTVVYGIKCEEGLPHEGTPLREINHGMEKDDPVYQALVKELGGERYQGKQFLEQTIDFIKSRRSDPPGYAKDEYVRWYKELIGVPWAQMGFQWDPKVSNPTEERPRVLYGDSRRRRIEMNKLAEKFLHLEESEEVNGTQITVTGS